MSIQENCSLKIMLNIGVAFIGAGNYLLTKTKYYRNGNDIHSGNSRIETCLCVYKCNNHQTRLPTNCDQKCDIFILQKNVESVEQEARSLKTHLRESNMQILKLKQESKWNMEQGRHMVMQQKHDKIQDESEANISETNAEKSKLENEIETLRSILKRTENEFLEKTKEMSRLKNQLELMDEESKVLKAQLQEKDKQLLNKSQGKYWNVDQKQLEDMGYDFQRKLEKINDECQEMVMAKATHENEVDTIRITLRKTELELSEKTSEISGLKALVKSTEDESNSLKAQLKEKEMLLRNWNWEFEQLDIRHKDLQVKFETIKDEHLANEMNKCNLENMNEKLRCMLRKTEQELSKQTSEISELKQRNESMNKESESLKTQLQEKDMFLLKQNHRINRIAEYEHLELRYKDLQKEFDKIKYESQAMAKDKDKLENENETLRSKLQKTEQDLSQQMAEMTRIKKQAASLVEESKSLHAQLKGNERQQLQLSQGRNLNVEYKQLEMRHNDMQMKFDQIEEEARALMVDKTRLENENEKLRSMLQKTEEEFSQHKNEMTRLKKHVESVVEKSESLKSQLQEKERQQLKQNQGLNLNVEYEQLVKRHNGLQRKFDKIEDEARALMVDKTKLENENEKLSSVLRKTEQKSLKRRNDISMLKKRVKNMDRELESLNANLQEKERQLQEEILATTKANAEKDYTSTSRYFVSIVLRLSRHMGQQMSEGTTYIPDLSDPNRPSKLGERYSELFDNEWTNAFEVLTENFGKDDTEAIDVLRTILLVGPECKRLLKEARKHININDADSLLENVLEVILSKVVDRRHIRETTLRIYTKECFLLCWYMSIQDPPVVLVEVPTKGSRFDTNIYKHYINSGDTVDYVVWPALLLHKGGPLLTKGVAQPLVRPR
ncbi:hypothetical protein ACJMK2_030590 [Sinanodonta woodiana]|uniref:Mitochondria-eating protein C-terminal domain-containing protein n=1 Tax=Sinanodonta woodiana TaxID=1069815 RepID=A0ABD3WY93_SINWO